MVNLNKSQLSVEQFLKRGPRGCGLIGLVLILSGCQVKVTDKEKPSNPNQIQVLQTSGKVYINELWVLQQDQELIVDQLELGPRAEIITQGFQLRIQARKLISQAGVLKIWQDSDLQSVRVSANSESRLLQPGVVRIHAEHGEGLLKVFNQGLQGASGISFENWQWEDLGEAPQGPTAEVKHLKGLKRRGLDASVDTDFTVACKVSNRGFDGQVAGSDALPGGPGETGGANAPVSVIFQQSSSFVIQYQGRGGLGGLGGKPSLPQRGQRGGAPGEDPLGVCAGGQGSHAPSGRPATEGAMGAAGKDHSPEWSQIQIIR